MPQINPLSGAKVHRERYQSASGGVKAFFVGGRLAKKRGWPNFMDT